MTNFLRNRSFSLIVVFILLLADNGPSFAEQTGKNSTGIVICTGTGDMFLETMSMLEHTRYRTNSSLPICLAHCDEMTPVMLELNTLMADSDVIWFKKPELLFDSPGFIETGSLFFRDRWTQTKNKLTLTKGTHSANAVVSYIESLSATLPSVDNQRMNPNRLLVEEEAHIQSPLMRPQRGAQQGLRVGRGKKKDFQSSGSSGSLDTTHTGALLEGNAYWRHYSTGKGISLDHMQDSSVVLLNKESHPRMLLLIKQILPTFNIGYGDKEIYWLAATAARERFVFEPHVAGSLGDCGALVHFDPRSVDAGAAPFYVNAEYLIDLKKLSAVGDFVDLDPSVNVDPSTRQPAQLTTPMVMDEATTQIFALAPWKNMKHGFYPCSACSHSTCQPAQNQVLEEIRVRQRMVLALKAALPAGDAAALTVEIYELARKQFESTLHPVVL